MCRYFSWYNTKRDRRTLYWQFLYPFLILILGLGLLKLSLTFTWPAATLNTLVYNSPLRVPYNNDTITQSPTCKLLIIFAQSCVVLTCLCTLADGSAHPVPDDHSRRQLRAVCSPERQHHPEHERLAAVDLSREPMARKPIRRVLF